MISSIQNFFEAKSGDDESSQRFRDRPVLPEWLRLWFGDASALELLRCLTIVVAFLLVWLTLDPFPNLQDPGLKTISSGNLVSTYLAFGTLALVAVLLSGAKASPALLSLCTPLNIVFCGWMLVNIALSEQPAVSLQRFALTASAMLLAVMVPLMSSSRAHLNLCLGAAAGIVLTLCYVGLLLAPDLSIHTAQDTVEPHLAGDWRGTFAHKNIAAPSMAIIVYLGIYLTATSSIAAGLSIITSAGVFLFFCESKSTIALLLVVMILAQIASRARRMWTKCLVCYGPVLLINVLAVGSVVSGSIASVTRLLPVDSTFTGRADIWQFALEAIRLNPIKGYGYAAFWENSSNRTAIDSSIQWAFEAAHSHNGYLELALTIGLPGLVLFLAIFVAKPLRDFHLAQECHQDPDLSRFFLSVWLFGLYLSSMETFLLDRQNPTWFVFVVAVAGLHFLSKFRVRA